MPYIDPILKQRYENACRRAISLFIELQKAGFPENRMVELQNARQEEDEALAKVECGHRGKNGTERFPVSKDGEKGRPIREAIMREFGIEPPPKVRKGVPVIQVENDALGLFGVGA